MHPEGRLKADKNLTLGLSFLHKIVYNIESVMKYCHVTSGSIKCQWMGILYSNQEVRTMAGEILTANAVRVGFATVNEIQEFVQLIKEYKGDLDMAQGRMTVDAKSILGICSLNMHDEMELQVHSGEFEKLKTKIHKFIK